MNSVIETILNHRSQRSFLPRPLSEDQIKTIVESAQAASTSSFIQAYSIIGITDPGKKKALAELAGSQTYVEENGHLMVFCADLYRHTLIGELEGQDLEASLDSTEKFMVACIDAALAAQNAAIAAESMGLGICYIGGIRNNLPEVCKVLNTPDRVIPLFGMVFGYPDQVNDKKPRLPFEHVYMEDEYQQSKDRYLEQLKDYNRTTSEYYKERTGGKRSDTWTSQMAHMLSAGRRMYMKTFVQGKGLNKK
ncbi:oxygen-insensitive NADPH nitroreductase [Peribacillus deserti]|uniref:Oxygen-insensitive NADPH nitroreductase n=1 Tax=Peribacillus deserti TaxID=673318 RepID=A0A2N5M444_9BACI|nr:oxygen-insensitive NADPH nitroreductase [Peribacillus deserti]PLT29130.1 oxygen-insensitive NADPH nitroreductase [Peribacillus deserti]